MRQRILAGVGGKIAKELLELAEVGAQLHLAGRHRLKGIQLRRLVGVGDSLGGIIIRIGDRNVDAIRDHADEPSRARPDSRNGLRGRGHFFNINAWREILGHRLYSFDRVKSKTTGSPCVSETVRETVW